MERDNDTQPNESEKQVQQYEPPKIRVMNETEMLEAFQVTSAGTSWWF